jgi:hypothetical protein
MGAQMNIKNAEAYAIAAELAEKEGSNLTQVVLEALRQAKRQREVAKEEKLARVMALVKDMRSRMSPETLAFDLDKELYDEQTGLPN